uniref:Uncharacterized protein n=1 Tax=Romanomermis culicivorax TaxID=13658 RepID=A0A915I4J8_ROMCU
FLPDNEVINDPFIGQRIYDFTVFKANFFNFVRDFDGTRTLLHGSCLTPTVVVRTTRPNRSWSLMTRLIPTLSGSVSPFIVAGLNDTCHLMTVDVSYRIDEMKCCLYK